MTVAVNPPKTPVTKGSNGIACATVPNICKMPGPPAPFIPTPLPNIGKSGDGPKGYTKKVKVEGKTVAIKGATFKSMGDMASKGTGGGLISANTHGPTKFLGPGSMNVKFEGKNVQLLSDPMLNNCGGSGSPPNSATMLGVLQMTGLILVPGEECPICGEAKHDDFKEDPKETKPLAKQLAGAFEPKLGSQSHSTMLAVAVCTCGEKKYSDKSGTSFYDEFISAADACGMEYRPGKRKKLKAALNAITSNAELVDDRWQQAEDRVLASRNGTGPTAYKPGQCAGPGALVLLLSKGGFPSAMTERWFHTEGKFTGKKISYVDNREGKMEPKAQKFRPGASVPPCATCELMLPLLLCPRDKDRCEH